MPLLRFLPLPLSLRTLAPSVPELQLLDLTIGYPDVPNPQVNPGVEPTSYPEDHYDLSLWTKNVPPSPLHFHLRAFKLADIPLGDLHQAGEASDAERATFDAWLRERWEEKDALMKLFYEEGAFQAANAAGGKGEEEGERVEWQVGLRRWWESAEAFGYGLPAVVLWFGVPWVWAGLSAVLGWLLGSGHGVSLERSGVLSPMSEL